MDLVRGGSGFAVDIGTEETGYHAELRRGSGSDGLEPVCVYRRSALIASEKTGELPAVADLQEWLRFVIEHVMETADTRV